MPRNKKILNKYQVGDPYQRDIQLKPIHLLKFKSLSDMLFRLCGEAGVRVWYGPRQRRMIQVSDILTILRFLAAEYRPGKNLGFDRMSLLAWFMGLEKELDLYKRKKPPKAAAGYARRLELEIHRIAQMDEPQRTVAAVEFMHRIGDAKKLARAAKKYWKEDYGPLMDTRYEHGEHWWHSLERLAGSVHGMDTLPSTSIRRMRKEDSAPVRVPARCLKEPAGDPAADARAQAQE